MLRIFSNTRETAGVRFLAENGPMFFQCCDCGTVKQIPLGSGGTGYGCTDGGQLVCYACRGVRDSLQLRREGKGYLYLTRDSAGYHVGNWPGTLRFPVWDVRKSWHNMAGRDGRRDFYFAAFGKTWHGVNIGNSQVARVRALKG